MKIIVEYQQRCRCAVSRERDIKKGGGLGGGVVFTVGDEGGGGWGGGEVAEGEWMVSV